MIGDQGGDIKQIDTNVSSANDQVIKAVDETKKVISFVVRNYFKIGF